MKVAKSKRKLAKRVSDYESMKGTQNTSSSKWVLVSGTTYQLYHKPGSMKK